MTAKSLLLATSMLTLVAISGQALAATQVSHRRHSQNEAQQQSADVVQQPENAFDSLMTSQATDHANHRYEGGPKSDIY
jgi:hypothetical protein